MHSNDNPSGNKPTVNAQIDLNVLRGLSRAEDCAGQWLIPLDGCEGQVGPSGEATDGFESGRSASRKRATREKDPSLKKSSKRLKEKNMRPQSVNSQFEYFEPEIPLIVEFAGMDKPDEGSKQ